MKITAVGEAFPEHYHSQAEITARLEELWSHDPSVAKRIASLHENVLVKGRHLTMPLESYGELRTFGETNDAWIQGAVELGERAVTQALETAGLAPEDVDAIFFSTVTGVASPSIDARLANRLRFRPDLKRIPMFGLGCVAGAAAVSRAADFVRGDPNGVALVLTIELCSLTLQLGDRSVANLISTGLFGDGATAAVVVGDAVAAPAGSPEIVATRSVFYPDTEEVMGWTISETGFRIVLSPQVPAIAREFLPGDVDAFLGDHGLTKDDIGTWVCHPGGPKVLEALQDGLGLDRSAVELSWDALERCGNLSSASVLMILRETLARRPAEGSHGVMLAMGPGFCSELLLLQW
ncbi:MAG: type III polyketide synthase [Planctomycetes bacterium]|nr:type III polyketide synthase [Planctomycetota bacterium]